MIDKNCFVTHGFDKDGRPLLWMRIANFNCENVTKENSIQFMIYLLDHVKSIMKPNVDQMVMIYEMENAGYANFSLEIGKVIIKASSELFVSTVYRMYIINAGFTVNCIYATIKPFLPQRAQQKIQFIGATEQAGKVLLQQIPID